MKRALRRINLQHCLLREAFRVLVPGGTLLMTWPASLVDPLLSVLHGTRLVSDEMESQDYQKRMPVASLRELLSSIGLWGLS